MGENIKLRVLPEDFIVEEIPTINISKERKQYKVYLLKKQGLETFALLEKLSAKHDILLKDIGFAGLKDRHAVTSQYVTIPSGKELCSGEGYKVKLLGFADRPLKLGDLKGNRFSITIRDIKKGEIDGLYKKAEDLKLGVPNYFDSQRFGSVIDGKFVAKYLIKGDIEKAVKTYLTAYSKHEARSVKNDKERIVENWEHLSELKVKTAYLQRIIEEYRRTKDWLQTYKKIPSRMRELLISAYQSYIWNESVKRVLLKTLDRRQLYSIEYNVGTLIYFRKASEQDLARIPRVLRTMSDKIELSDYEKKIILPVLEKEELEQKDFRITKTGNFFTSQERQVLLFPEGFTISVPAEDERHRNSYKITVSFSLPKGSYATVILKKLIGA